MNFFDSNLSFHLCNRCYYLMTQVLPGCLWFVIKHFLS